MRDYFSRCHHWENSWCLNWGVTVFSAISDFSQISNRPELRGRDLGLIFRGIAKCVPILGNIVFVAQKICNCISKEKVRRLNQDYILQRRLLQQNRQTNTQDSIFPNQIQNTEISEDLFMELFREIEKTEKPETLPLQCLEEVEKLVMEYHTIPCEDVKISINKRLEQFLEALEKTMFIDRHFKADIKSLIENQDAKFLKRWQKLFPKLLESAHTAPRRSQQILLNKISEKDQKRLEGIVEGLSDILQMYEQCQKIDEETIQTLKVMLEVIIEQFDTTKPQEKQIKHWLNNSMAVEKFWQRLKPELGKIKEELNKQFLNTPTPEPEAQEPNLAEINED